MNRRWNTEKRWKVLLPLAAATLLYQVVEGFWLNQGAPPVYARQADAGYADPASCMRCHAGVAASYRQTGMGQSFHRAGPAMRLGDFTDRNRIYNKVSDRYYTMVEKDGAYFEQRFQIGFEGKETNREEMRIDYVVGSGNHALTYLHRTGEGKLIELPVSWYSEQSGYWEMSPGYDDPHQQDFLRAVPYECMSCHNAYPPPDPALNASPDKNIFGTDLPEGIDCQRCHGPGQAHVDAVEDGESDQVIRATIVNPARLSRDRQMEVCMQCHLETTSWPLPHSISRFEHTAFSYRPGEPLENYQLAFDHKPVTGHDDDFEVVHQAYQLRKSACFRKSQMTCLTCHDPHVQLRGEEATKHYLAICMGCHAKAHATGFPGENGPVTSTSTNGPNCLTCHMWKRRTSDAVHVVMTDHYIQRYRPKEDPLTLTKHSSGFYSGEVIPYYPDSLDRIPEGELYLAIAQTEDDSNLAAGAEQLKNAIHKIKPAGAEFYFAMGAADSKLGRNAEAIQWYEEALRRRPDDEQALRALASTCEAMGDFPRAAEAGEKAANTAHPDTSVLTDLGSVYLKLGRLDDAKRVLQQALTINPDLSIPALLLGMIAMREGDTLEAEAQYRTAIDIQPDLAEPHNNLAGILARRGSFAEAAYEYEKAIQGDPANAQIRQNYSVLLAHTGALSQAEVEAREAVRLEPKSAQLHANLGDVLMKSGEDHAAELEYRAALALDQQSGEANLRLADLLAKKGAVQEARKYYEAAAKSSDSRVRDPASNALQR